MKDEARKHGAGVLPAFFWRLHDAEIVAGHAHIAAFAGQLGEALLGADAALVLPIYPAREAPIPGVTAELVAEAARRCGHRQVLLAPSFRQALAHLEGLLQAGDVLLTLGAGNVGQLGEQWLGEENP